jgi:hypothetical protein
VTVSVGNMIRRLSGLVDTTSVSDWENRFIRDMVDRSHKGTQTSHLSGGQVEKIEQIFTKHFAG